MTTQRLWRYLIFSRRPLLSAVTMSAVFSLAGILGYRAHSQVTGPRRLTPFTVYEHETAHTENPKNPPRLFDSLYARRGDGSWTYRHTSTGPHNDQNTAEMIEFIDFRTQNQAVLEPFTHSAVVFHLTEKEAQWENGRVTDCSAVAETGARAGEDHQVRMISYDVARVVRKHEGVSVESWVAPALDCFPLLETETFPSGSRNTRTVYRIEPGEPPDSLFAIPPDYVLRSPQQLDAEYKFKFGVPFWGEPAVSNVQRRYERGLTAR